VSDKVKALRADRYKEIRRLRMVYLQEVEKSLQTAWTSMTLYLETMHTGENEISEMGMAQAHVEDAIGRVEKERILNRE
jgi:hypothetical protein